MRNFLLGWFFLIMGWNFSCYGMVSSMDTIFLSGRNKWWSGAGFVFARKKQIQNGNTRYAFITSTQVTAKPDSRYSSDFHKFLHSILTLSDFQQDLNPNYPDTRFVFGYAHEKEIYTLEIEGQKPDGAIEIGMNMAEWPICGITMI